MSIEKYSNISLGYFKPRIGRKLNLIQINLRTLLAQRTPKVLSNDISIPITWDLFPNQTHNGLNLQSSSDQKRFMNVKFFHSQILLDFSDSEIRGNIDIVKLQEYEVPLHLSFPYSHERIFDLGQPGGVSKLRVFRICFLTDYKYPKDNRVPMNGTGTPLAWIGSQIEIHYQICSQKPAIGIPINTKILVFTSRNTRRLIEVANLNSESSLLPYQPARVPSTKGVRGGIQNLRTKTSQWRFNDFCIDLKCYGTLLIRFGRKLVYRSTNLLSPPDQENSNNREC
uniref:Arrestin_N domain-containing protein n=1 Tax=Strongyloides papillosus TaxID=174720 RepID=A0A0N5CHD6_STREA